MPALARRARSELAALEFVDAVPDEQQTVRLEYAPCGLIGCLTPQANTTAEPEFNILLPTGYALLNARLTSDKDSIEARLADYAHSVERHAAQFANAPLHALALAVTGASYLIGREREDALVARLRTERDIELVTAARAVCDALAALSATRIALVSPYPPALTDSSVGYWRSRGFDVRQVDTVFDDSATFHPIYSLRSDACDPTLDALSDSNVDAILMLGTGLPTLQPIAARAAWGGPPVLSSMLCLAWRAVLAVGRGEPDAEDLRRWLSASDWRARLPGIRSSPKR